MCNVCLYNLYVVLSYSRCLRIGLKGSGDGPKGLEGGIGTSGLFKLGASRRGRFVGSKVELLSDSLCLKRLHYKCMASGNYVVYMLTVECLYQCLEKNWTAQEMLDWGCEGLHPNKKLLLT